MVELKSNNSITSGLTTCGGCPGEPETVGTSYPFYSSYGPGRSCQTLSLCRLHSHTRRLISTMRAWTMSYRLVALSLEGQSAGKANKQPFQSPVNLALCSMAKMRDRLQKPVACSNLDSGLALANNNENRHGYFDLIYFFLVCAAQYPAQWVNRTF